MSSPFIVTVPGRRLDEAGEQPHQRRLARAGQAHHDEHLAGGDVEGHVADTDHAAGLGLQVGAAELGVGRAEHLVGLGAEDLPELVDLQRAVSHVASWPVCSTCAVRPERQPGPVAVVRHRDRRERRVAEDQVGGLLGHHHHRRVDVAVGDVGEHGGVHDPQPLEAVHLHGQRIGHGSLLGAHLGSAGGVQGGLGVGAHPVEDLLVGLDARPGGQLAAVVRRERGLVEDQPGRADRLHPLLAVGRRGQVVEQHARVLRGSVLRIFTCPRVSAYIGPTCTW